MDPPSRLVSSPFLRCTQTLEPLAVTLDLPIETTDLLAEGADGGAALDLMTMLARTDSIACCTRGDVL
jgi:8-oxo-dGTP diphosphatase